MSSIMNHLKKIEGVRPENMMKKIPADTPSIKPEVKPVHRDNTRLALTLLAVLVFGILGYYAGLRSQKGDIPQTELQGTVVTETAKTETTEPVTAEPVIPDEAVNETATTAPPDTDVTGIMESESNFTIWPPAIEERFHAGDTGDRGTPSPETIFSAEGGTSGTSGDTAVVKSLAEAIIRATDEPVSEEEDVLNRRTIQELRILGVVEENGTMVAVISGRSVKEGDEFRQFIVEEITNDYVVLSFKRKAYRKNVR